MPLPALWGLLMAKWSTDVVHLVFFFSNTLTWAVQEIVGLITCPRSQHLGDPLVTCGASMFGSGREDRWDPTTGRKSLCSKAIRRWLAPIMLRKQ